MDSVDPKERQEKWVEVWFVQDGIILVSKQIGQWGAAYVGQRCSAIQQAVKAIQDLRSEIASNHKESKERFHSLELSFRTLGETVEDSKRKIQGLEEENESLKKQVQENIKLLTKTQIELNNCNLKYLSYNSSLGATTWK